MMLHQTHRRIWFVLVLFVLVPIGSGYAQENDPVVISEIFEYDTLADTVSAVGDRVYVTSTYLRDNKPWSVLKILDVRQPQTPVLLSEYASATMGRFTRICVVDSIIYISYYRPTETGSGGGIQIIDSSTPTTPVLLSIYEEAGMAVDVAVVDQRAYLAYWGTSPGIHILDVSNPTAPTLLGQYVMEQEQRVNSLDVQDHLVYIASDRRRSSPSEALGGLHVVDVHDPTAPTLVGHYEMEWANDVQVVGNHAYVGYVDVRISPGPGGQFLILDVSRPSAPTLLGSRWSATMRMQVVGDVAYIVQGEVGVSVTYLLDVSDPTAPHVLPGYIFSQSKDIAVVGEYVYAAARRLDIIRLSTRNDEPVTDLRCFTETGHCISGRIRTYWEEHGGLAVFGLPLTPRQFERRDGRLVQVQWFERHRLELHADNEPPYDVLLGRLGAEVLEQQGRDWQEEFPRSEPQDGCQFMAATGHAICGAMLTAWQTHGLELGHPGVSEAESLALFGLPLSDAHTEHVSNGQSYQVQWFERARMEWHPTNEPPYQVLFGRLGAEVREE